MVRIQAKKAKGDEAFATRKQKVGKKKLAPATATRAEVHAKTLRIVIPTHVSNEQKRLADEKAQKERDEAPVNIREALSNAGHYRAASRKLAFHSALRWVKSGEARCPVRTLQLVDISLRSLTDTEDIVRSTAADVLGELHQRVLGPSPGLIPPVAPAFLRHLNISMTHAEKTCRVEAAKLLSTLFGIGDGTPRDLSVGLGPHPGATFLVHCAATAGLRDELRTMIENVLAVAVATRKFAPFAATLGALLSLPTELRLAVLDAKDAHQLLMRVTDFAQPFVKDGFELKGALYRNHEKLADLISLCHSVGYLLTASGAPRQLSAKQLIRMRHLFVDAIPFTAGELCKPDAAHMSLACALAHVCLSLTAKQTRGAAAIVVACTESLLANPEGPQFTFAARLAESFITHECADLKPGTEYPGTVSPGVVAIVKFLPKAMTTLTEARQQDSAEAAARSLLCVRVLETAYESGAAAIDASVAMAVAGLPRVLFGVRRAQWDDAAVDRVVSASVSLITKVLCDPRPLLGDQPRKILEMTIPSLFSLPTAPSAAPPGATPPPQPQAATAAVDEDNAASAEDEDDEDASVSGEESSEEESSADEDSDEEDAPVAVPQVPGVVSRCAEATAVAATHASFYASPAMTLHTKPATLDDGRPVVALLGEYGEWLERNVERKQLSQEGARDISVCAGMVPDMIREAINAAA